MLYNDMQYATYVQCAGYVCVLLVNFCAYFAVVWDLVFSLNTFNEIPSNGMEVSEMWILVGECYRQVLCQRDLTRASRAGDRIQLFG